MAEQVEFGIRIPDIFKIGFSGYVKNIVPLTLAAAVTLAVYGLFRFQAQQFLDDGADFRALVLDLAGLVLAATIAYPWYAYALQAARGEKVDLRAPFSAPKRFPHQAMGSFFFFAGVLAGVRWGAGLFFLPAMMIAVLYAFYGYVVADTPPDKKGQRGGFYALGTSVRLGENRRFGIFAIGLLFSVFNFFGAMFGLALEDPVAQYPVTIAGLIITTSITLVSGAAIYDVLREKLDNNPNSMVMPNRTKKSKKKKGQKRG